MRRKQILDEAFKLFARDGYGATTMQKIGSAVGLDKSSLYVHFKNKSEIFLEILALESDGLINNVISTADSGDGCYKTVFRNMLISMLHYFKDQEKLLFWKHIMLISKSGAVPEVAEQTGGVFKKSTIESGRNWIKQICLRRTLPGTGR